MTNTELKYYKVFFKCYIKLLQHTIEELKPKSRNKGVKHGRAKLTQHEVAYIKWLFENKHYSQKYIAKKFEVSEVNIHYIKIGRTWSHIKPENTFKNVL